MTKRGGHGTDDWGAVAKAITERMADLRISQVKLVGLSGIKKMTIHELMHNKAQRDRRPETLELLSVALGWHKDHLAHVRLGKEPPEPSQLVEETAETPRLDAIEDRLTEIAARLGAIESRLARLDTVDANLTKVLRRIDGAWPRHQ
jgi:hypothetical protein